MHEYYSLNDIEYARVTHYYCLRHCLDLCWAKICKTIETCKAQGEAEGKTDSCIADVLDLPDSITCETLDPSKVEHLRTKSTVV